MTKGDLEPAVGVGILRVVDDGRHEHVDVTGEIHNVVGLGALVFDQSEFRLGPVDAVAAVRVAQAPVEPLVVRPIRIAADASDVPHVKLVAHADGAAVVVDALVMRAGRAPGDDHGRAIAPARGPLAVDEVQLEVGPEGNADVVEGEEGGFLDLHLRGSAVNSQHGYSLNPRLARTGQPHCWGWPVASDSARRYSGRYGVTGFGWLAAQLLSSR